MTKTASGSGLFRKLTIRRFSIFVFGMREADRRKYDEREVLGSTMSELSNRILVEDPHKCLLKKCNFEKY
jgi:hypothetical protein